MSRSFLSRVMRVFLPVVFLRSSALNVTLSSRLRALNAAVFGRRRVRVWASGPPFTIYSAAHRLVAGHDDTPLANRLVVTQARFDQPFLADLADAKERIVIYSPFITHNRLATIGLHLRAAVERGVAVLVVTKPLDERKQRERSTYRQLANTLTDWGITVIPKKAMHEKVVLVDHDIVWVGSLNPLSFRDTREIMERRHNRRLADDYRNALQIDAAVEPYQSGEQTCPICGSELALAEGRSGLYRRCVVTGCYQRGLNEPPLTDGKMVCRTCGGELYFGEWGEEKAWRCHENSRHRQKLHPNHLKLPAMAALIPTKERNRLKHEYGTDPAQNVSASETQTTLADLEP